jgi:hypothetical protein
MYPQSLDDKSHKFTVFQYSSSHYGMVELRVSVPISTQRTEIYEPRTSDTQQIDRDVALPTHDQPKPNKLR